MGQLMSEPCGAEVWRRRKVECESFLRLLASILAFEVFMCVYDCGTDINTTIAFI